MSYSISTWRSLARATAAATPTTAVAHSSYYGRISLIGYNSTHLNGSLHLLEGIRAGAFNKCLNLSHK